MTGAAVESFDALSLLELERLVEERAERVHELRLDGENTRSARAALDRASEALEERYEVQRASGPSPSSGDAGLTLVAVRDALRTTLNAHSGAVSQPVWLVELWESCGAPTGTISVVLTERGWEVGEWEVDSDAALTVLDELHGRGVIGVAAVEEIVNRARVAQERAALSKVLASVQTRIARPATLAASTVVATIRADFERRLEDLHSRDAYGRSTTFGALLALMTMAGTLAHAASSTESYDALIALRDEIDAAIGREFCVGGGK